MKLRAGRRFARGVLWTLLLLALLAPLLCNDVPIVASVGGELRFPALQTYFGAADVAPAHGSWKQWWARLLPDSGDWAVMPPYPYGPLETDPQLARAGPSLVHWLGNDDTGRDVCSRLVHGCQTAVAIGLGAALIGLVIGVPLGALAGYRGGLLDQLVLRLVELFLCFPALLFLIAALALLGRSMLTVAVVLGALFWTSYARIVRGEFLSLREREFVLAARGLGVPDARIVLRHLLPQTRGPVLTTTALAFAAAVVAESTLSFLGLGPQLASWGAVLAQGKAYAADGAWHLWLFPSLAIIVVVASLQRLAEDEA
jgi:peptide/nickel transport system permease protein